MQDDYETIVLTKKQAIKLRKQRAAMQALYEPLMDIRRRVRDVDLHWLVETEREMPSSVQWQRIWG